MTRKVEPLIDRLRAEAAEWSAAEPAHKLMLEAAERLEAIAAEVKRRIEEEQQR